VGAKAAADMLGINLIMLGSEAPVDDIPRELEILNQIIQDPTIDGLIMTTPQSGAYDDIVKKAGELGIPVATTNSFDPVILNRNAIKPHRPGCVGGGDRRRSHGEVRDGRRRQGLDHLPETTALGNVGSTTASPRRSRPP
jgi:simple sugar transport system substrate-binding protein